LVNQTLPTYGGDAPTARERRRIADESGRDAILFDMDTSEAGKISLWDQVDEIWSSPFERAVAMEHYLAKVLYKCSGCKETSLYEGDIEMHLTQLKVNRESHAEAQLERGLGEGGQTSLTCTGCGAPLSMRKNQGQKHIDRMKNDYQAHAKEGSIDVLLMHRYTTSPSVSMPSQVMNTITFGDREPEVHQVNRSEDVRPARRRRRNRRRR
jgi:hypothetical protein